MGVYLNVKLKVSQGRHSWSFGYYDDETDVKSKLDYLKTGDGQVFVTNLAALLHNSAHLYKIVVSRQWDGKDNKPGRQSRSADVNIVGTASAPGTSTHKDIATSSLRFRLYSDANHATIKTISSTLDAWINEEQPDGISTTCRNRLNTIIGQFTQGAVHIRAITPAEGVYAYFVVQQIEPVAFGSLTKIKTFGAHGYSKDQLVSFDFDRKILALQGLKGIHSVVDVPQTDEFVIASSYQLAPVDLNDGDPPELLGNHVQNLRVRRVAYDLHPITSAQILRPKSRSRGGTQDVPKAHKGGTAFRNSPTTIV